MSERRYGWVMVALGAFMTCIAIGAMFSLAVFLQPITIGLGAVAIALAFPPFPARSIAFKLKEAAT